MCVCFAFYELAPCLISQHLRRVTHAKVCAEEHLCWENLNHRRLVAYRNVLLDAEPGQLVYEGDDSHYARANN